MNTKFWWWCHLWEELRKKNHCLPKQLAEGGLFREELWVPMYANVNVILIVIVFLMSFIREVVNKNGLCDFRPQSSGAFRDAALY